MAELNISMMLFDDVRRVRVLLLSVAVTAVLVSEPVIAADSDLWTTQSGPGPIAVGTTFATVVEYGNHGPDASDGAYVESYFTAPMGLDVFLQDYLLGAGNLHHAIQSSAEGTDTLGNEPLLRWDDTICEDLVFRLRGDGGGPIDGLGPGVSASFSYQVGIPMTAPRTGSWRSRSLLLWRKLGLLQSRNRRSSRKQPR